jgi:flagellar hook-associated protein FlgK
MAVGTLGTALGTLIDSLNTNQSSLSYISNNIANANTVGYSRRLVSQETKVTDGVASGVGVVEVRRAIDEFVQTAARNQITNVGYSSVKSVYYDRLHNTILGQPNSSGTVGKSLSNFYTALDSYSNDPSSAVKRTLSVNAAKGLTTNVSNLASQIQNERLSADVDLSSKITELNGVLTDLADLNLSIQQNYIAGGDINSLYDVRDQKLSRLKELFGANININSFGQVTAYINNTEVLSPSARYALSYSRISSVGVLVNDAPIAPIMVDSYDPTGTQLKSSQVLFSASNATEKVDNLPPGELKALVEIRDVEYPKILSQLDELTYATIEQFNKVHNLGSGYPPAQSFTGQEEFAMSDKFNFSGKFRLALVDATGNAVDGPFGDKLLPMVLDFDNFDSGTGPGTASVKDIINEINRYYNGQSAPTVNLGPLKDIKLGTVSTNVTSTKATGTVTFSSNPNTGDTVIINGVTLNIVDTPVGANDVQRGASLPVTLDNLAAFLNSSSNSSINSATYTSNASSLGITHNTSGANGNSFTINAGTSGAAISGSTLAGGVNASGNFEFDFDLLSTDSANGNVKFEVEGLTVNSVTTAYTFNDITLPPGVKQRTGKNDTSNDTISVAIPTGLNEGGTFTIGVNVKVTDSSGNVSQDIIYYTVTIPDPEDNIINNRINATSISGTGDAEQDPSSIAFSLLTAKLVNGNGNQITDNNTAGYLKLESANSNYRIVFDDLSSSMDGEYGASDSSLTATQRGLGHMFGLNNLFNSSPTKKNSAINFSVRSDISSNPSMLSSARLTQATTTGVVQNYSYQIGSSSNAIAQELVKIQNLNVNFDPAGGLPELSTTLDSFSTEIYNFATVSANAAEAEYTKQELLYNAIESKIDEIGGVNIDEEVAQTINIQNNYTASARILSVVKELFDQLNELLR